MQISSIFPTTIGSGTGANGLAPMDAGAEFAMAMLMAGFSQPVTATQPLVHPGPDSDANPEPSLATTNESPAPEKGTVDSAACPVPGLDEGCVDSASSMNETGGAKADLTRKRPDTRADDLPLPVVLTDLISFAKPPGHPENKPSDVFEDGHQSSSGSLNGDVIDRNVEFLALPVAAQPPFGLATVGEMPAGMQQSASSGAAFVASAEAPHAQAPQQAWSPYPDGRMIRSSPPQSGGQPYASAASLLQSRAEAPDARSTLPDSPLPLVTSAGTGPSAATGVTPARLSSLQAVGVDTVLAAATRSPAAGTAATTPVSAAIAPAASVPDTAVLGAPLGSERAATEKGTAGLADDSRPSAGHFSAQAAKDGTPLSDRPRQPEITREEPVRARPSESPPVPQSDPTAPKPGEGIRVDTAEGPPVIHAAATFEAGGATPAVAGPHGRPAEAAPSAHPAPVHPPHRQLADAIVRTKDGIVEIQLDPVELGRVTVLLGTDHRASLGIIAERPDTLDLIRRHSDQLLQDLRDNGMPDARLDFMRQDGRPDGRSDQRQPQGQGGHSPQTDEQAASQNRVPSPSVQPEPRPGTISARQIDIRL